MASYDALRAVIAEESRTHTVLSGKYLHLLQRKYSQYLILLRIFSLHLRNICSRKTAQHSPALNFLMDFVKASRSKIRILQGEIWRKTRKILAAGRMSSALFGYSNKGNHIITIAQRSHHSSLITSVFSPLPSLYIPTKSSFFTNPLASTQNMCYTDSIDI